jgi:hypothetical protein
MRVLVSKAWCSSPPSPRRTAHRGSQAAAPMALSPTSRGASVASSLIEAHCNEKARGSWKDSRLPPKRR